KRKRMMRMAMALLCCVVLMCTVFGAPSAMATDYSEELSEANQKLNELNQQKQEIQSEIDALEEQAAAAEATAETYEQRASVVQQQISAVNDLIDVKTSELAIKQEEIDAKQREYDADYETFKERLGAMYKSNNATTLSVILGADSFSEMLTYAETVARISEHDRELMQKLQDEKAELEADKADIEDELASLESDKSDLDSLYSQYAGLLQEANAELSAAEAEQQAKEEDLQTVLDELEEQEAIIDEIMKQASVIDYVPGEYIFPLPYSGVYMTSGFGWRTLYGKANYHGGIDLSAAGIYGKSVLASKAGQVVTATYGTTGYGYYVIIDHGGGYKTLYGHMSAIYVTVGQYVSQGEAIGAVGSTGNSTGPHLHFEVRLNGEKQNPLNYVSLP
ncbi:MAG: murein hydrolase activator EnvC family protein, partial [Oscillospiraceae bacterium]